MTRLFINRYVFNCLLTTVLLISCNQIHSKIDYRQNKPSCIIIEDGKLTVPLASMDTTQTDTDQIINVDAAEEAEKATAAKKQQSDLVNDSLARLSHQAYLINTSQTDSYSFTVKRTPIDSTQSTTEIIKLNPGEERMIGCDYYFNDKKELTQQSFQVVGEQKIK